MAALGSIGVQATRTYEKATRDWTYQFTARILGMPFYAPLRMNGGIANTAISGTVKEGLPGVARQLLAYRRDNFELIGKVISNGDGSFSLALGGYTGQIFVVALDDAAGADYNAQIFDRVVPS